MNRVVLTAYGSSPDPLKLAMLAKKENLSSSQMILKLIRDRYTELYGETDPNDYN